MLTSSISCAMAALWMHSFVFGITFYVSVMGATQVDFTLPTILTQTSTDQQGGVATLVWGQLADINGDGLLDQVLYNQHSNGGRRVITYLNTGCGFIESTRFTGYCTAAITSEIYSKQSIFSLEEASAYLRISERRLLDGVKQGLLRGIVEEADLTLWRFHKNALDRFAESGFPELTV